MSFLQHLRERNLARCEAPVDVGGYAHPLMSWTPLEWAGAAAGEMGEACNYAKKLRRQLDRDPSESELLLRLSDEIADTVIYLDLLCARVGLDLEAVIVAKFNATSDRFGCDIKLEWPPDVVMPLLPGKDPADFEWREHKHTDVWKDLPEGAVVVGGDPLSTNTDGTHTYMRTYAQFRVPPDHNYTLELDAEVHLLRRKVG